MMANSLYTDLKSNAYVLSDLSPDERKVLDGLFEYSEQRQNWPDFRNHWMAQVDRLYSTRGLSRREMQTTVVYRVAQDLASRLAIRAGIARAPGAHAP